MKPYWSSDKHGLSLYLGDCLQVLPTLEAGNFDAVVTDPPYSIVNEFGVQKRLDGTRKLEFEWDKASTPIDIAERIAAALSMCHIKSGMFVFCGTDQVGDLLPVFRSAGFIPKPAAWVKKCPPPAMPGTWWPSGFELAFYGYRHGAYFGDDDPKRSNVFVFDGYRHGQPGKVDHPTQKPLALIECVLSAVCPRDGIALEPFAGSGTTLVAAYRTGRKAIGIEIEEKYCEIAAKRLEREIAQGRIEFEKPPMRRQEELFTE